MLCDFCHKNEATIHLTQVIEDSVKKVHLCAECAAKGGLNLKEPISITDLLLGLGKAADAKEAGGEAERACPRCGMRPSDFKKKGRLGCADCYEAFSAELMTLIKGMHRSDRHKGKVPTKVRDAEPREDIAELERKLEQAVAEERYEEAAQLRDRLQRARGQRESP